MFHAKIEGINFFINDQIVDTDLVRLMVCAGQIVTVSAIMIEYLHVVKEVIVQENVVSLYSLEAHRRRTESALTLKRGKMD